MKKLQIGETLTCGYSIDANYCNLYVLAYSATARQPYAVWNVDSGGNTRNGRYFSDAISAQKCFAYLCFDWLKASEIESAPKNEQENYTGDNFSIEKTLRKQMQLLSKRSETCNNNQLCKLSIAMAEILNHLANL